MTAEIVQLRSYTLRDIPAVLREIASQIESGDFPGVTGCAVVVEGESLDVCLAGETHSQADAYMLLAAGMTALMDARMG